MGKTGKETVCIMDGLILEGANHLQTVRYVNIIWKWPYWPESLTVIFGVSDLASQTFFIKLWCLLKGFSEKFDKARTQKDVEFKKVFFFLQLFHSQGSVGNILYQKDNNSIVLFYFNRTSWKWVSFNMIFIGVISSTQR